MNGKKRRGQSAGADRIRLMMPHEKLRAWKMGRALAVEAYRLSRNFPRHELSGMTSQIRRAAVSVPANIAEGAGRQGPGEFPHFLSTAAGSLAELETLLGLAQDLRDLETAAYLGIRGQIQQTGIILNALTASLKRHHRR